MQQEELLNEVKLCLLGGRMNKPRFLIRISSKETACTGAELLLILNIIHPFIESYVWYAADVEIIGEKPFKLGLEEKTPRRIGTINNLHKLAQKTDQFLSGVFFALQYDVGEIWNREFSTEDESFRDLEEANLEIRAFDTTYFEIYSNDSKIMSELSKYFHAEVKFYK